MGVSSLPNRVALAGDGSSTSFTFPYYFFSQADLLVFVYDTVAGMAPLKVLNSDYTISGTPNAQGLYVNGANVVFGAAPPASAIVVIVRSPTELQNYSLGQNGAISSVALVQQMDYLTLLVQRLEDQVSRAICLPDGVGPVFSAQLPTNIALMPGMFPQVNAAANGLVLGGGPFVWQNVVIPYTSFNASATSQAVTAFSLPPKYILAGTAIKHSIAFAGTSITDVQIDLGISGNADLFLKDFDVLAAVSDSAFDYTQPNYISSWANAKTIQAQATSVGANLSALSAGSVTIWYLMQNLAF